jgi:hypothetical protein
MSTLLSPLIAAVTNAKAVTTTLDGQQAIKLTAAGQGQVGYEYVTYSAHPELLEIQVPGPSNGGQLNFTYTGLPQSITPPPASDVLDASQFGL